MFFYNLVPVIGIKKIARFIPFLKSWINSTSFTEFPLLSPKPTVSMKQTSLPAWPLHDKMMLSEWHVCDDNEQPTENFSVHDNVLRNVDFPAPVGPNTTIVGESCG